MKRPTELIEKAKGFKSTDPIRLLAEYAVSLEAPQAECNGVTDDTEAVQAMLNKSQPRKTVSDAVEYYKGVWSLGELDILFWSETYECYGDYSLKAEVAYKVCTREEFEAEVERRKGGEWSGKGKPPAGTKCKIFRRDWDEWEEGEILFMGKLHVVFKSESRKECAWDLEECEFKPIKPTISKDEAWDKLCNLPAHEREVAEAISDILEKYEVK